MRQFLLSFAFSLLLFVPAKAQTMVSHTLLRTYSFAQIDSLILSNGIPTSLLDIDYEVEVYKITYMTTHPRTGPILASGALMVPKNYDCALPMSSYQHGTVYHKDDVPSRLDQGSELVGLLFSTSGYWVAMPDFIGLGDSPGMHPYIHADSEADATIDLIRASYQMVDTLGGRTSDQLFLFGYSQGGHVTMAAHKKMQEQFPFEFDVTASAPMAGPYDASGVQAQVITSNNPYPAPEYLPYVIFGLQDAYGTLYDSIQQILVPPYDSILPPLFDGTYTGGQINAQMPSVPNQILVQSVLDSFTNNPNDPLRQVLALQNNYDWTPQAPVKMVYCEGDMHVSYLNAIIALDSMTANGAPDVEAVSAGASFDHGDCAFYAFLTANQWFKELRELNNGMDITWTLTHESTSGASDGAIDASTFGITGPFSYSWSNGATTPSISGLSSGIYVLTVTDTLGCSETHLINIGVASAISEFSEESSILVYPNPSNSHINIKAKGNMGAFTLYDVQGRKVMEKLQVNSNELLVQRPVTAGGLYYFVVLVDGKQVQGKLIWE